jgi:hypothetical protein
MVNDAERLRHDPERWIVGGKAVMSRPAERVVAFYNKRGTCEQWIKEWQSRDQVDAAVVPDVRRQSVRLQLHVLANNLAACRT